MIGRVARRYAKALLAVATEQQLLEPAEAALAALRTAVLDPEIAAAFANPLLAGEARRALVNTIAESLDLPPVIRDFLLLLADANRLDKIGGIADQYETLLDDSLGRVRAKITSATPLPATQADALVGLVARRTSRKVLPDFRVDPALLGGVVVDVAGTVYDGSLRTQFERMAAAIAGGRSLR